jgi:hypothetical protein
LTPGFYTRPVPVVPYFGATRRQATTNGDKIKGVLAGKGIIASE